jgi:hypothetical protein
VDSQDQTAPQPEVVTPIEHAYATLIEALNARGLDQRSRILAATGMVNYELARQIGSLIELMTQPPTLIDYGSMQAGPPPGPGE